MRAARSISVVYQEAMRCGARTKGTRRPRGFLLSPRRRRLRPPSSYHWAVTALTGLTAGGGCAAKYSAARLDELLKGFVPVEAENLLVGLSPADDAAVYKLDDERAIVFTVDFFPPLVDDPAAFGRIAATNALNDVFAMGGTPLLALSIAAFPEELPTEVLGAIFAAADEQVRAAGALLAGGHTIRDAEPKYGLAVVGTVHPEGVWRKSTAEPGDALFLTKPLGTGLVLAGHARELVTRDAFDAAVSWMTTLNGVAADAVRPFSPNAVTDVTGFGLLGHLYKLVRSSGVSAVLDAASVPYLDAARGSGALGSTPGGSRRNLDWVRPHLRSDVDELELLLLADAQTSGGLLVAGEVPGYPVVGELVAAGGPGAIRIR
jgi:selenide, water dikinase